MNDTDAIDAPFLRSLPPSFGGYVGYKSYTCSAYISAEGNLYALTYPM